MIKGNVEKLKSKFKIEDTFAIKGIAILMMLFHHMFLGPKRWGSSIVDYWPLTQDIVVGMAVYFKICVSLFVFLSAYGLTVKYKQIIDKDNANIRKFVFNRWYKMEMNFLFVFVLLWIYGRAMNLMHLKQVYGQGIQRFLQMAIDGLGLARLFGTVSISEDWWYMSLAVIIIVFFPILFDLYKKYGIAILVLSVILPLALRFPKDDGICIYLPCIIWGIIFADKNLLVYLRYKLVEKAKLRNFLISCMILVLTIVLALVLNPVAKGAFVALTNGFSSIAIIIFAYTYLRQKYIWNVLIFLGRHSMNIFFIHYFIRGRWYHDFIYGFRYFWLDTLILLIVTVLISMGIGYLKKVIGYSKLLKLKI